nr:HNH endonuclease [uncultured Dysosmobacter sp.]
MAKNEAIAKAIATDPYLKDRKSPTAVDQQLYLKEVSFVCPLCGKILRHRKQKKANKLYEIAHIFPNNPTEEQYEQLSGLPRLGDNSESFENKIALCKDCHDQQDYHTTQADYLKLLDIKQHFLISVNSWRCVLTPVLPRTRG